MADSRLTRGVVSLSGTYRRPDLPRAERPRTAEEARLEATLREDPWAFSFFQAVRVLERLYPERAPVGGWADPADEVARFGVGTSLAFPASEIQALTLPTRDGAPPDAAGDATDATDGTDATDAAADVRGGAAGGAAREPARMTVNFLGLTGPQGVLPHVYTEHAAARARVRDTAFRDFLDVFHHRVLSLFYRAWQKHKFVVSHETGGEDRLYDHLLDLAGLGTSGLRHRMPVPDDALAFYAGLFAMRSRPADGLGRLVGDYFGVRASVEQFVGEWRHVDAGGQCALGDEEDAGRLGFGVLGDAAWDPHASVTLRLGPLTRAQFDAFLPGGSAHDALRALARLYANDEVGVHAQLVLARDEVPPCTLATPAPLGAGGRLGGAAPLGRGTWLASRPMTRDPDETMLLLC